MQCDGGKDQRIEVVSSGCWPWTCLRGIWGFVAAGVGAEEADHTNKLDERAKRVCILHVFSHHLLRALLQECFIGVWF